MCMGVKLSGDGSQDRIDSADDVYSRYITLLSMIHLHLSSHSVRGNVLNCRQLDLSQFLHNVSSLI